jgi:ABC-2 type transport system permease protein
METTIPSTATALTTLLKADFITQWRNRRSVIIVLLVPIVILITWKPIIPKFGPAFVLGTCITLGLTAIGLMGYSNSLARDRDKGIFQRLRVAPVPTWCIMVSRLSVQLAMILLLSLLVFIVGYKEDNITLPANGYVLGFLASLLGGALYLGLGQMIVGLVKNFETVNSTTRLVYFVFIMVGLIGEMGILGNKVKDIVKWSPYGTVKTMVAASMQPNTWTNISTGALLATLAYALVFSFLGIKWFRWNVR